LDLAEFFCFVVAMPVATPFRSGYLMFTAPVPSQDAGNQPGNKQAEKPIDITAAEEMSLGSKLLVQSRRPRWHTRFDVRRESGILVLRAHGTWVRACAVLASAMLVSAVLAVRERLLTEPA